MNLNQKPSSKLESNSNNNDNTVSVPITTITTASTSTSASTVTAGPLKLPSVQDCIYNLKSCKCDPAILKSIYTDILDSVIDSVELIELEELFNNNIIKSIINNNTAIQVRV